MTPRPIQHSITYWSGVITLLFILFAWAASLVHGPRVGFAIPGQHVSLGHARSSVILLATNRPNPSPPPIDQEPALSGKLGGLMPTPGFERRDDGTEKTQLVLLPHWLILLVVALLWIGLLVWRDRRVRRTGVPAGIAMMRQDP